jgi:hypothetical protein
MASEPPPSPKAKRARNEHRAIALPEQDDYARTRVAASLGTWRRGNTLSDY